MAEIDIINLFVIFLDLIWLKNDLDRYKIDSKKKSDKDLWKWQTACPLFYNQRKQQPQKSERIYKIGKMGIDLSWWIDKLLEIYTSFFIV